MKMIKVVMAMVVLMTTSLAFAGEWMYSPMLPPATTARITIQWANYSAMQGECDATQYVGMVCQGKGDCSFQVSNNMCGDPAHGKQKVLTVNYKCSVFHNGNWFTYNEAQEAYAYEHKTLEIHCPN